MAKQKVAAPKPGPTPQRSLSKPIAQQIINSPLGRAMPELAAKLARNAMLSASDAAEILSAANPELVEHMNAVVMM